MTVGAREGARRVQHPLEHGVDAGVFGDVQARAAPPGLRSFASAGQAGSLWHSMVPRGPVNLVPKGPPTGAILSHLPNDYEKSYY